MDREPKVRSTFVRLVAAAGLLGISYGLFEQSTEIKLEAPTLEPTKAPPSAVVIGPDGNSLTCIRMSAQECHDIAYTPVPPPPSKGYSSNASYQSAPTGIAN